jgi:hypothetical protein
MATPPDCIIKTNLSRRFCIRLPFPLTVKTSVRASFRTEQQNNRQFDVLTKSAIRPAAQTCAISKKFRGGGAQSLHANPHKQGLADDLSHVNACGNRSFSARPSYFPSSSINLHCRRRLQLVISAIFCRSLQPAGLDPSAAATTCNPLVFHQLYALD